MSLKLGAAHAAAEALANLLDGASSRWSEPADGAPLAPRGGIPPGMLARPLRLAPLALLALLPACGKARALFDRFEPKPARSVPEQPFKSPARCEPGKNHDYPVGPGQKYAAIGDVPLESLEAGDTVRVFFRAEPYR